MIQQHTFSGTEHRVDVFEQHKLQCTEGGANKFWTAIYGQDMTPVGAAETKSPYVVILRWGKIGTAGQDQVKRFRNTHLAEQYVRGRLKDKENKGYVSVDGKGTVALMTQPAAVPYVETEWDLL